MWCAPFATFFELRVQTLQNVVNLMVGNNTSAQVLMLNYSRLHYHLKRNHIKKDKEPSNLNGTSEINIKKARA